MISRIKKENLDRFYETADQILPVKLSEFNKIRGHDKGVNFTQLSLHGGQNGYLNDINDVILTVYNYEEPRDPTIAFEFWFDNERECIKSQPVIKKLRTD